MMTKSLLSQGPRLQNIPIRTPLGKMIRCAFVAPPGSVILSTDYASIEKRIMARLSESQQCRRGEGLSVEEEG